MGINLGDIIKDGRDIFGDGVNVAARLEALAEPGGICVSRVVRPKTAESWSLTSLREKRIKIGAKVVSHGHYTTFRMADVAVPRQMFQEILMLIAQLRAPPAPA
jgi:class 3 adenylate cyclase